MNPETPSYHPSTFFYQILQKEKLNCDDHQYQPNEQSSLILSDLTEHKSDHDI